MSKKHWIGTALAVTAIGLGWWWLEQTTRPAPDAPPATVAKTAAPTETAPPQTFIATAPDALVPGAEPFIPPADASLAEVPAETPPTPPGVPSVGDILAIPGDDYVKIAKQLGALALDSRATHDERVEALAHALNLSAGNEAEVLTPLVKDPRLPDELADTILSEALNRPLSYQADLYLEALAARTAPAMQTRIREHLAFLTNGPDRGPNPIAWKEPVLIAKKGWE